MAVLIFLNTLYYIISPLGSIALTMPDRVNLPTRDLSLTLMEE